MFLKPKGFIAFVIDSIISTYDTHDPQQKQKALVETNEYLKTLNPIYQDEYKRYIAQKLNVREHLVQINKVSRAQAINLSKIDIAELSILKHILEDKSRLDGVLDIIDSSMFEFHVEEFNTLIHDIGNPSLNGILLNEALQEYSHEEFEKQLLCLLDKFYNNKLTHVTYAQDMNFKEKVLLIRKIKDNIKQLKIGKLIKYNL